MTTQQDRELRDWLRSVDPAADLKPAPAVEVTALLARAEGRDAAPSRPRKARKPRTPRPERTPGAAPDVGAARAGAPEAVRVEGERLRETRPDPERPGSGSTETVSREPRARTAVSWLVTAAAVLVVGVAGFALSRDDEPAVPPSVAEPAASSTTIGAPDPASTRCVAPTPELLSGVDVAVDATVRAVEDGKVRLSVQKWYAGTPTEELVVEAPPDTLEELIGAPDLQVGQRYLLAARAGELMVCGFSGPLDPDRSTLYTAAFGE